mmetsp:Transcript_98040/g.194071  ORF Transcript_98040/g.194071 Transcript_98040/m.194071 type:complete len:735 (+) Transcript_98040:53-2257(+)|eukprot:CAMPEP_0172674790 /NCGR_PEP_ID=MMETSP1074-20121228/12920_1 /TAXON_ID=2916 /ORGANISM="Ceratium fusus, Strain PA161109" /LENGTH=734 /DNA_ID=CAMNT_0013492221 /DNA_START=48 /DNA_END=2252 /DNA_ORIENTATION=-
MARLCRLGAILLLSFCVSSLVTAEEDQDATMDSTQDAADDTADDTAQDSVSDSTKLNPIEQTISLMTQLQARVVQAKEVEEAAYHKYAHWCEATTHEIANEIKISKRVVSKLQAQIQENSVAIAESSGKIEQLAKLLSTNDGREKAATQVRESEEQTFKVAEKGLVQSLDMLDRAIRIVEKQAKKGASFMQSNEQNIQAVLAGLRAVVGAAGLDSKNTEKLTALVQDSDGLDLDEESDAEAPDPSKYESHSSGIIDVMEDLRDEAEGQLRNLRTSESKASNNYKVLMQSLKDEASFAERQMQAEKQQLASDTESKAKAGGDLTVTSKELKKNQEGLGLTQGACMQTAADHEASLSGRDEELKALTAAKQKIQASMASLAQTSFLQVAATSGHRSKMRAGQRQALIYIKHLASEMRSSALVQLASRVSALNRYGTANGEDPFVKVRGLIEGMIARLIKERDAEAQQKAYCDSEMKKTNSRKDELEDTVEGLKGKLDKSRAARVSVIAQIQELQAELATQEKLQKEMTSARQSTHKAYVGEKAQLKKGLDGVRSAMRILRDYYASKDDDGGASLLQSGASLSDEMKQPAKPAGHKKASGAGAGIIGLLEVVESDLAKELSKLETEEDTAQRSYESVTQENKVSKTMKQKDIRYRTAESKELAKSISEFSSDLDTESTELAAVKEYLGKLLQQCVNKPDTFEERQKRRLKEIQGLQEALDILQGDAPSFLQIMESKH